MKQKKTSRKNTSNYVKWLGKNITEKQVKKGVTLLNFPFYDGKGDSLSLYVIKKEDKYLITDGGDLSFEMELRGITIDEREVLLMRKGHVKYQTGNQNLVLECTEKEIPEKLNEFIQFVIQLWGKM